MTRHQRSTKETADRVSGMDPTGAAYKGIVTGGAKGIGLGCASVLCGDDYGYSVAIIDKDWRAARQAADQLSQKGPGVVTAHRCDVANAKRLAATIREICEIFGGVLHFVVNNAGWHPPETEITDITDNDFMKLVRTNLLSTFVGCREAVRIMLSNPPMRLGVRGRIVNISSMAAVVGQPGAAAYCATKAGQNGIARSVAREQGKNGIICNVVAPSNVRTPLMEEWAASTGDLADALKRVAANQALGRMAEPEEVGKLVAHLVSPANTFTTGQVINCEGGAQKY